MIVYRDDPSAITVEQLGGGFFEGWPSAPTRELHLAHLRGAEISIVAIDTGGPDADPAGGNDGDPAGGPVVGFVTAIGDGVLTAFVPLLEVLPPYRGQGIGRELMRRVLDRLGDRYSIDLVCDPDLAPFYERLGGTRATAILWRNRDALQARTSR